MKRIFARFLSLELIAGAQTRAKSRSREEVRNDVGVVGALGSCRSLVDSGLFSALSTTLTVGGMSMFFFPWWLFLVVAVVTWLARRQCC